MTLVNLVRIIALIVLALTVGPSHVLWSAAQATKPSPSSAITIRLGIRGDDFPKIARILEPFAAQNIKVIVMPLDNTAQWLPALKIKQLDFVAVALPSVHRIFEKMARDQLRIAAIILVEYVHIASRENVAGRHLRDLARRKVSQGPPQSSSEFDSNTAFAAVKLKCGVSVHCRNADYANQPGMLARKEIDAFFVTDRAPTPTVVEAGKLVSLKLLTIDSPVVAEMNRILGREYYSPGLLELSQYARRFLRPESISAEIKLDPTTGIPTGIGGKITLREPTPIEADRGILSIDRLLELTDRALMRVGLTVWILLDRLDVAFAEQPQLEDNALRALFKTYLDLLPREHIRLKIFLRSDIWVRLTDQGFREASHITRQLTIKWDPRSLLNLVVRRTLQNDAIREFYRADPNLILGSSTQQNEFFYRVFPTQVDVGLKKPRTFDWMLSRTLDGTRETAPRELIQLLNSSREVQLQRYEIGDAEPEGDPLFAGVSLKEALPSVSRQKLEQTLFAEYPSLRDRINQLRGQRTRQRPASLAKIWELPRTAAAIDLARQLVKIGFFEELGTRDEPEFSVPFLYRDALDMIQGTATG